MSVPVYTYTVKFNLYYASEGGYNTGHSNVTVVRTDENGDDTKYVFGANSALGMGNVETWVNPYSSAQDGIIGEDYSNWTPDNPNVNAVSSEVSISEADYQKILDFVEPYTGSDYTGSSPMNYDVFASVNPLSPDDSWSCYSFSQHIYELIGGSGNTFVDEFTDAQLNQLTDNYIETFYGDLDAGRNIDNLTDYLQGILDDYGWAWNNRGALFGPLLPGWVSQAMAPYGAAERAASPLVIDVDGDGIELSGKDGPGAVYWDLDQDGFREASGWIVGGNGLLANVFDEHNPSISRVLFH